MLVLKFILLLHNDTVIYVTNVILLNFCRAVSYMMSDIRK